jgi:hypothetical protein
MGDNSAVKVRYALGSRKQRTSGPKPRARVSIVRWNLKEWTRERPQAKSRADEQKSYIRQTGADELASQSEVPCYPNLGM